MAKGVQFRGTPDVMRAYDNMGLSDWSIVYDGEQQMKSENASLEVARTALHDYLKLLEQSNTTAAYKLKVFVRPKNGKLSIKASTEADYGFYFTLFNDTYQSGFQVERQNGHQIILSKLEEMQLQINTLKQAPQLIEEEQEATIGEIVQEELTGFLRDPEVLGYIKKKMFAVADKIFEPGKTVPMDEQRLGKVGAVTPESEIVIDEEQTKKVQAAVEVLARIDDKLGDHLWAIAEVANTNPKKYKKLISMLETFL